jgi:GAF domain-containing protein
MTTSAKQQTALTQLRNLVNTGEARDTIAKGISEAIARGGNYRWVGIYDVGPQEIRVLGWTGPAAPAHPRFLVTQGLNGQAVRRCQPVTVHDVTSDPHYLQTLGSTRSEMVVPVVGANGAVVGTIDVESETPNRFGEADLAFVRQCAETIAPLFNTDAARAASKPRGTIGDARPT